MRKWMRETLHEWPWVTFVSPIWAVASIINAMAILLYTNTYLGISAYEVKYSVAPWYLWVGAYLVVSLLVLIHKDVRWTIIQAGLTITEGIAIFFASFMPEVSPLAGMTFFTIGLTICIGVLKSGFESERDTLTRVRRELDEET